MLLLVSDAFGGFGGISRFNRDFAAALSTWPRLSEAVILPRRAGLDVGGLPPGVRQLPPPGSKAGYLAAALREACAGYDMVLCGHINLTPVAAAAARLAGRRARLGLVIHGVDAWTPRWRPGLGAVDLVLSVSRFTLDRFGGWAGPAAAHGVVIPNTADFATFTPGPRPAALAARYGLEDAEVVMGLARLDLHDREKGFDEMLEALPGLVERRPRLRYMLCGDGTDRPRLQAKARALGIADRVVFTGLVPEAEKADHYRLADAFVLCGRQEGFGIVLLEAMGCGVPVVASSRDASAEAVGGGRMGEIADPDNPDSIRAAVLRALDRKRPHVPPDLVEAFGHAAFARRLHAALDGLLA
ncbi:MAG TPA: glycosyltransferase family 4 protein [Azospirillaceae bacterium]|nr:glycosyltransferase family 4 protein [Azospirillaceae bacterium]